MTTPDTTIVDSHIPGRKAVKITTEKQRKVVANSLLNNIASFSYLFQIKTTALEQALICKGDPFDPSAGTFYFKKKNGYLYIYLHDSDNTHSLVYKTVNPVLRRRRAAFIAIIWNQDLKKLDVYLDAVKINIAIDTTEENYLTDADDFNALKSCSSDIVLGDAAGEPYSDLTFFYHKLTNEILTGSKISEIYNQVIDDTSYENIGKIAFSSDRFSPGRLQLCIMDSNGDNPEILHSSGYDDYEAFWSYDGEFLVFTSSQSVENTGTKVFTINKSGGQRTRTILGDGIDYSATYSNTPSFSPDGLKILASRGTNQSRNTHSDVFAVDVNTSVIPPTTANQELIYNIQYWNDASPVFKPDDDNIIAFVSNPWYDAGYTGTSYLCLLNLTTDDITYLDSDTTSDYTYNKKYINKCRFNHAGTKLVYEKFVSSNITQIFIIDADGSNKEQLTSELTSCTSPSFSPDGTKILFTQIINGKTQLHTMNIDGSDIQNLSSNKFNEDYGTWTA